MISLSAHAVRDHFAPINGKNYYEVLGIVTNATQAEIKSAHRELMMKYHPDVTGTGSVEKSQNINSAYDVLKDPEARRRYDNWLSGGTHYRADSRHKDDGEFRRHQINLTVEHINREAARTRNQYPHFKFDDMVEVGRTQIIYYVRFLSDTQYTGAELYDLIFSKGVNEFEHGWIGEDSLAMLAGGALMYLSERARQGMSEDYRKYLRHTQSMLEMRLKEYRGDLARRQIYDNLWKIMSGGQSYYPPAPVQQSNECSAVLTGQVTKDGVTYTIPIRITIKIGF